MLYSELLHRLTDMDMPVFTNSDVCAMTGKKTGHIKPYIRELNERVSEAVLNGSRACDPIIYAVRENGQSF